MTQRIEVAICTRNRAELLRGTLFSIANCLIPNDWQLRVIVVDNDSTDETPSVLESCNAKIPLTAVVEKQLGHTHARNAAIAQSEAELVVWTDDDVCVPCNWLDNYIQAYFANPTDSFWGGAIRPVFPTGLPDWLAENWAAASGCFAERDLGDDAVEFTPQRLPFGANFAVQGNVLRQFLFDTRLGRRGHIVLGDDEIEYLKRLIDNGHSGKWVPHNGVEHVITSERTTENYVWRYFIGQGIRLAEKHAEQKVSQLELYRHVFGYYAQRPWAKSPAWFAHLACWGLALGKRRATGLRARQTNRE